ncbi:DUF2730 family protein [Psychrobacter sp. I-STPA10]|uniref:DUF2730 family protein n=1 Tax=Psychrobacter sp. I-STPA10 TaxID=2585769 RepID=UPI001E575169|nr:DUF2730 family protein [Psychrobacter sp. I-STPA10]
MRFDIHFIKFTFDVVQTVVMVGISIYVWIVTNHKANAKKIVELEAKHNTELDELKTRVTSISTQIKHMPDRQQISRIHYRIDDLNTNVSTVQGIVKGLADSNAMILEKLIK